MLQKYVQPRLGYFQLKLLSAIRSKPRYGYEVLQIFKSWSGKPLHTGLLYSTLQKLEANGYIESWWKRGTTLNRKYYSITKKGETVLDETYDRSMEFKIISEKIHDLWLEFSEHQAAEVRRILSEFNDKGSALHICFWPSCAIRIARLFPSYNFTIVCPGELLFSFSFAEKVNGELPTKSVALALEAGEIESRVQPCNFAVYHQFAQPERWLETTISRLSPLGKLVMFAIRYPDRNDFWTVLGLEYASMLANRDFSPGFKVRFYSEESLKRLLKDYGLKNVTVENQDQLLVAYGNK